MSKCPAIENFNIHETLRLTNDILRLIFTTLKRLKHFRIYNEFEEDSVDRKDRPWLEITRGCKALQVNINKNLIINFITRDQHELDMSF